MQAFWYDVAMPTGPLSPEAVDDDSLLTTVGLFMEAHAGMVSAFERRLVNEGSVCGQSFEILLRLLRSPGHQLRMSELAAQTTLTASGLTRAVDRLERQSLVRREACAADRRVSYAVLTSDGEAEIGRALPIHVAHLTEVLTAALSADELDVLGQLMRRLRDAVNPQAACASDPTRSPV